MAECCTACEHKLHQGEVCWEMTFLDIYQQEPAGPCGCGSQALEEAEARAALTAPAERPAAGLSAVAAAADWDRVHQRHPLDIGRGPCSACGHPWPCEVRQLLDALAAAEAERDNERHDVEMLSRIASVVYDEVTGGRISKPNTIADDILSEYRDRCHEDREEAFNEGRIETEAALAAAEAEVARLRELLGAYVEWSRTPLDLDENFRLRAEYQALEPKPNA